MKKFLKGLGIGLLVLIVGLFVAGWIISEPLPEGKSGPEAEALAKKVLTATNQAAWDTTKYVRWNFADRHQLLWDRNRKLVQVEWGENRVILNTQNHLEGMAWEKGKQLEGEEAKAKLNTAWAYFCNDSFWLNAPGKVFDPGTSRKTVELEDGTQALLITYSSGGTTPGDSYLWILNEEGLPIKWKMWVSIIPIGGIEATWDKWKDLSTGGKVATSHQIGWYESILSDIQAGNDWVHVGVHEDPFAPLF
jgi:hypothetical protein